MNSTGVAKTMNAEQDENQIDLSVPGAEGFPPAAIFVDGLADGVNDDVPVTGCQGPDGVDQLGIRKGLGHELGGAASSAAAIICLALRGQHQTGMSAIALSHFAQHIKPAFIQDHDIQNHEVRCLRPDQIKSCRAVIMHGNRPSLLGEQKLQRLSDMLLVFNKEIFHLSFF